jgi:hypothetical protein
MIGKEKSEAIDSPGERFAAELTAGRKALAAHHASVARIKILYDLYAIALDISKTGAPGFIADLAEHNPVRFIETPKTYPLSILLGFPKRSDGVMQVIRLSGGLTFQSEIQWLNDGDVTPLSDIVLKSRPGSDSLSWFLPLKGWRMPNAQDLDLPDDSGGTRLASPGFMATVESFTLAPSHKGAAVSLPTPAMDMLRFDPMGDFPPAPKPLPSTQPSIEYVGGVSMQLPDDGGTIKKNHTGSMTIQRNRVLNQRSH